MANREKACCTRKNLEAGQNWVQIPLIITCGTADGSTIMGRKPLSPLSVCVTRFPPVPLASLGHTHALMHTCTQSFYRPTPAHSLGHSSIKDTLRPSNIHPTTLEASSLPSPLQLGQLLPPPAPLSLAVTAIRHLISYLFLGALPARI